MGSDLGPSAMNPDELILILPLVSNPAQSPEATYFSCWADLRRPHQRPLTAQERLAQLTQRRGMLKEMKEGRPAGTTWRGKGLHPEMVLQGQVVERGER